MQFNDNNRPGYRGNFPSPRDRQHVRDWHWSNNGRGAGGSGPKTYFKKSYGGPSPRGFNNRYGYSDYRPRQGVQQFRGDSSMNSGRGRPSWRKVPTGSTNVTYKRNFQDDSVRWRSPQSQSQPRRASPLRPRENASPHGAGSRPRCPPPPPSPRSDAKRPRMDSSDSSSSGKENASAKRTPEPSGSGVSRFYGNGNGRTPSGPAHRSPSQSPRRPAPPPSPRKSGDAARALYGGQAQAPARELALSATVAGENTKHSSDPLFIGLPNYGNSCYQNATLQSLLGLPPFVTEMMALRPSVNAERCRTLRAVARLMQLRQKAQGSSVSTHLNELRDVFARIDPAFRGTDMQDANEFLLRLLDTIKEEVDGGSGGGGGEGESPPRESDEQPANPVRDNFEYQTVESYMCTKCHESVLKRQENVSWFVSVPRRQAGASAPTLQDALRLSMRPDRRELHCENCQHDECNVTTQISKLPRTLILQLNRYVYVGEESRKIRANVEIPKFVSLSEYTAGDATFPPAWDAAKFGASNSPPATNEAKKPELSTPTPPAASAKPPSATATPTPFASTPSAAAHTDVVELEGEEQPGKSAEDEESQLQEAIRRSLEDGEQGDNSVDQAGLSQFCVEDDEEDRVIPAVDPSGAHTYRLVGVVSHYGGATQAGHYVADVYNVNRRRWFHYDDRSVSCVSEQEVLGDGHQKNGYIFFYLHNDLCSQLSRTDGAGDANAT